MYDAYVAMYEGTFVAIIYTKVLPKYESTSGRTFESTFESTKVLP